MAPKKGSKSSYSAPRQTAREQYMQNLQAQSNLNSRYVQANSKVSYNGVSYQDRMSNPLWYQQNFASPIYGSNMQTGYTNIPFDILTAPQPTNDDDELYLQMKAEYDAKLLAEYEARLREKQEAKLREEQEQLKREEEARIKKEHERLKKEEEARIKKAEDDKIKEEIETIKRAEQEAIKRALLKAEEYIKEQENKEKKIKEDNEREELAKKKVEQANIEREKKILQNDYYLSKSLDVFKNILVKYLEITDFDKYIKSNIIDEYQNILNTYDTVLLEKFYKELKLSVKSNDFDRVISTLNSVNLSTKYLVKLQPKCSTDEINKIFYEYLKLASHIKPEII